MGSKFKENYFRQIDSKEKAYWLGFIYADGGISCNRLCFSLSSKDRGHLVSFCKSIGYDCSKIKSYKRKLRDKTYSCSDLSVFSKKIVSDLAKLGCIEKKTYSLRFPKILEEFRCAFLVGFYDGDGCRGTSTICSGSREFLQDIKDVFGVQYDIKHKINPYGECYTLSLGRPLLRNCFLSYSDGLERKRVFIDNGKVRHFSETSSDRGVHGRSKKLCPCSDEELQKLVISNNLNNVSKKLGVSRNVVKRWCCEKKIIIPSAKQKNISHRKFEVSKGDLKKMINNMSFCEIGRHFNVSDNAVRKRAKFLGLL